MASSKYLLAEQVQYRLNAGNPELKSAVLRDDLYKAIEQKVNALLRAEHFSITLASGETIPDNLALATYEDVAVLSMKNGRSKCTLPVMPVSLPRNMGVFSVEDPNGKVSFIPILPTQRIMLKSQKLINDLMGQVGWEGMGRTIEFTKDLTLLGLSTVNMLLVVLSMDAYGETDALPISSSMEEQIINSLFEQFAGLEQVADAKNNKA